MGNMHWDSFVFMEKENKRHNGVCKGKIKLRIKKGKSETFNWILLWGWGTGEKDIYRSTLEKFCNLYKDRYHKSEKICCHARWVECETRQNSNTVRIEIKPRMKMLKYYMTDTSECPLVNKAKVNPKAQQM